MFDSTGLVVSLPARELARAVLPGSVFDSAALAKAPISDDLRLVVQMVEANCLARGIRMVLVARPEIFIDPITLTWLHEELGGIRHHLCISDGLAIRVLPDMQNHMFLYRLGIRENADSFRRLAHRAPTFLAGLASQVNTAFRFKAIGGFASPPSQVLQPAAATTAIPVEPLAFHSDPTWIIDHGATDIKTSPAITRATYVPLTETALADEAFRNIVAALIVKAYFDPSVCVLLRLPVLPAMTATLADRLAAAITPLRHAKPQVPRVPSPRVFFLPADADAATMQALGVPVTLLLHDSFDFWRHPAAFYDLFAGLRVLVPVARRGTRAALLALFTQAFGRRPDVQWLKPEKSGFP